MRGKLAAAASLDSYREVSVRFRFLIRPVSTELNLVLGKRCEKRHIRLLVGRHALLCIEKQFCLGWVTLDHLEFASPNLAAGCMKRGVSVLQVLA